MGQSTITPQDQPESASAPRPPSLGTGAGRRAGFQYGTGDRPLEGYTIKYGIDHGGFGEVYYAVSDAGKEVALKLLRRNLDIELRGVGQCLNLKHPHLLSVFDVRQDTRGDFWIIMEYVAGESLEDRLSQFPAGLPVDEVAGWFQGIASGLAYLHDRGLVHRDLKPSNIFREEGIVKIGDYSLCKFISTSRRSGHTESVGTVHYMAPEIANGRYGREVDIYAAGVILYEMLTGRVPFDGESVGEILMKHMVAQPDLSLLQPVFRPIVARALEKDPEKRYADIREMAAEVARACQQLASVAGMRSGALAFVDKSDGPQLSTGEHGGLRELWRQLRFAWRRANLDTPTKFLLVALLLIFLFTTAGGWIPLVLCFLVLYGLYTITRGLFRQLGAGLWSRSGIVHNAGTWGSVPGPPPATEVASSPNQQEISGLPPAEGRFGSGLPQWLRKDKPAEPALTNLRDEAEKLLGSFLIAVPVTVVMNLIMLLPLGYRQREVFAPELVAWLMAVSILAAWMVLATSSICRAMRIDPVLTRFLFMVGGLLLGVGAWALAAYLDIKLPLDPQFTELPDYRLPSAFYNAEGQPQLAAFLAAFGSLFLVLRWWRYVQEDRPSRLSVVVTAWCGLVGWLIAALWAFPQPWLLMIACATAVTVQLSSGWSPKSEARG